MTDNCPVCPPVKPSYIKMKPEDLLLQIALDGIVIDEKRAEEGECECAQIKSGDSICWDKGIVGALSKEQQEKYCKPEKTTMKQLSPKLEQRYSEFAEAAKQCEIGKTVGDMKVENLIDRIHCMHQLASGV